ncbi:MCE family protein [Gordonia jinghuaiqii]|uniref:MCE family protein n=1 Tax=Gordonia jinghuaiqii TaxID=2758710 RepID=A0A7D7RCB7_9ACTN|nr:MlaD family protein [Gordonia jinghuaiqii]MCR5978388.1 MCE family protein [Gordonia jinghuaiqii]QMT02730.1 MCE family protein [Gordonia jinghuaiqii]
MITKNRLSVLAMVILAVVSVAYIVQVGLHVGTPAHRNATVAVPDTNGILVGSRVLARGIEVGRVTDIRPTAAGAELDFEYDDSLSIPVDSTFRVDSLSALGEAYIAVLPHKSSGPYLSDGALVDSNNVESSTTFKELSERLTVALRQIGPQKVQRIFRELDTGLPEGGEVVADLNRAGSILAAELTQQRDAFVTLLATLQPLLIRSGPIPQQLRETSPLLDGFGHAVVEILVGARDVTVLGGPLFTGIRDGASPFLNELQAFLDTNSANLNTIGVNLLPAARAGAASLKSVDLGRLLNNFVAATHPEGAVTVHVPIGGR